DTTDSHMPCGFLEPDEARLGEAVDFLSERNQESLTAWWLKIRRNANTPNWDIVSTCTVEGRRGLILIEAKAHNQEAKSEGKPTASNAQNHNQIREAIEQANTSLNTISP